MTVIRRGKCLSWVNRVILVVGRLLPVFPWKRTSSGPVAMSQRCQMQTADQRRVNGAVCYSAPFERCRVGATCRCTVAIQSSHEEGEEMAPILRVILTSTVLLGLGWASQLRAEEQKLVWPEIVSLSLTIDGKP